MLWEFSREQRADQIFWIGLITLIVFLFLSSDVITNSLKMVYAALISARSCLSSTVRRQVYPVTTIARCFSDDGPKKAIRKVKKKEKKSKAGEMGRPKDLQIILASLDAKVTKPPPADEEEMDRRNKILKNYTIGKFERHNEENHELACKLRLKKHAIRMLPKNSKIREMALEVDDVGPPRWRKIPAWTPPIPGFNPKDFSNTEE